MGVKVTAPDGRVWEIERHWPRRLRWRRLDTDLSPADAFNVGEVGDLGDGIGGIIGAMLVTVALVVFAAGGELAPRR